LTAGNNASDKSIVGLKSETYFGGIDIKDASNNSITSDILTGGMTMNSISNIDIAANGVGILNLSSGDNTFISSGADVNINSDPSGDVYINGSVYPPASVAKADTLSITSSSSNIDYPMVFGIDTAGVLTALDNTNLTYNPSQKLLGIDWPSGLQRTYLSSTNMRVGSSVGVVGNTESFCNLYAGGGTFESYTLSTAYGSPILDIVNKNSASTINQGVPAITLKKNGRSPLLNDKVGQIFFASNNGIGNGYIDIANITGVVSNNVTPISGQIDFNANNATNPNLMFRMDGNSLTNTCYRPLDMNNQTISNASTITANTGYQGKVYHTDQPTTNLTYYLTFVQSNGVSGFYDPAFDSATLTYNPSTNLLFVAGLQLSGATVTGTLSAGVLSLGCNEASSRQFQVSMTSNITGLTCTNRRTNGVYTCTIYNVSGSVFTISNVLTGLNKTDYAAPIIMNNGDTAVMTIRTLLANGVTSNYTSVSKFV
jgi:hypothetical protein